MDLVCRLLVLVAEEEIDPNRSGPYTCRDRKHTKIIVFFKDCEYP